MPETPAPLLIETSLDPRPRDADDSAHVARPSPESAAQTQFESGVVGQYFEQLSARAAESWNRFWFTPTDPATLGAIRVLTGLILVYTHWVWGLDFESFFGPESWVTPDLLRKYQQNVWVFSLWYIVPYEYVFQVHMLCLGALSLFTFGVFTRVTSVLSLLIVISYANRLPTAQFGLDQVNCLLTFYLACGPSGAAFSIDSWLSRQRDDAKASSPRPVARGIGWDAYGPSIHANVAIRLIQLHMCVIYLFAGFGKLQGTAWWDGRAMWLAFSNREYQTLDLLWLSDYPWVIEAMTHATIFWEVTYCVFVWFPLFRPIVLLLAVVTHVGIGLCMGMWTFGLIMLFGNLAFVPPHIVRTVVHWIALRVSTRRHGVKAFEQ